MPIYVYAIINAALALLIGGTVIGLQLWSILTQHHDAGCEDVRLRVRRIPINVRRTPRERRALTPQAELDRSLTAFVPLIRTDAPETGSAHIHIS